MPRATPKTNGRAARGHACYRIRLPVIDCDMDGDEEAKRPIKRTRSPFWLIALVLLAACHASGEGSGSPVAEANRDRLINAAPKQPCVNLNRASAAELMQLPGVGEVMSRRIIQYRERHGPFRRPEEIIIIENFSEKKYRAVAAMICVE
jgi:competence ComEA-like helix-hairpin-helix protein